MTIETSTPSLTEKAVAAMRTAVARVVEDHRRRGKPLAVWRGGRVVQETLAAPDDVRETISHYQTDKRAEGLDDKNDKKERPA
jgi:hypothetical protein